MPHSSGTIAPPRQHFWHIFAEVDSRRLYAPAGYPSMFEYCVRELGLSEQATYRRIQVARAGRRFPRIFPAIADGRLHLTAVLLLAPRLTPETADELLQSAAHKTKGEIEQLLARRFPQPDLPAVLRKISELEPVQLSPAIVNVGVTKHAALSAPPPPPVQPSKLKPLAPQRFALQVTVAQGTHDKLQRARELLSHRMPSGDLAQVLDLALDVLLANLERRKHAATDRPHLARISKNTRNIPAHVRRDVWKRDRGRCTFVGCAAVRTIIWKPREYSARASCMTGGNAQGLRRENISGG